MFKHLTSSFLAVFCLFTTIEATESGCGFGEFAFHADYLYWKACTDGVQIGFRERNAREFNQVVESNSVSATAFSPEGDFESGVRVGFEIQPWCHCWDFSVNWTHFSPESKTRFSPVCPQPNAVPFGLSFKDINSFENFLINSLTVTSPFSEFFFKDVVGRHSLDLDLIDLDFGYRYCLNSCLSLRHHLGVRLAEIDQEYKVNSFGFLGADVETEIGEDEFESMFEAISNFCSRTTYKNDFCGAGPRIGLQSDIDLFCGFGMYGDLAVSILYGERKTKFRQHDARFNSLESLNDSDDFHYKGDHEKHCLHPIIDLAAGINWSKCVCNCVDLNLAVGWESSYYFNQGAADGSPGVKGYTLQENSGLGTHGVTFSFGVVF